MAGTKGPIQTGGIYRARRVSAITTVRARWLISSVPIGQDGRPKGFGTALFASVHDAARAVELFNG